MIIDDQHKFAFVHIPKCGGTSIRKQIIQLDSYKGEFGDVVDGFAHKRVHPVLGLIAYAHIPLAYVRDYYPEEFTKLLAYRTFALVRDPHARFASATFQRLSEFGGVPRSEITSSRAIREAQKVATWLHGRESFCDVEYIHFSRQIDFVVAGQEHVVDNLFPLENIAEFGEALQSLTGAPFDPDVRDNVNYVLSDSASTLKKMLKPLYSRLTSWEWRKRILGVMRRQNLQHSSAHYAAFKKDPQIRSFVESYYAEDFALYRRAKARLDAALACATPMPTASAA